MKIAVVVPNRNGAGLVGRCVEAAAAAGADEIVVVDDGSDDSSPAEAAAAGAVVVHSGGRGFAAAVNRGVAETRAHAVLLLNSDCFLDPDALEQLGAAVEADPRIALCGAGMREPDGARAKSHGALVTLPVAILSALTGRGGRSPAALGHGIQRVPFVPLACALARRTAWDAVGGLDERYVFYFEDHDICWRLRRAGFEIAVCWDAAALHVGGGSSSARDPQRWFRQYHASRALYLRKRYPRAWPLYAAVWVPSAVLHAALWVARSRNASARRWACAYLSSAFAGLHGR